MFFLDRKLVEINEYASSMRVYTRIRTTSKENIIRFYSFTFT